MAGVVQGVPEDFHHDLAHIRVGCTETVISILSFSLRSVLKIISEELMFKSDLYPYLTSSKPATQRDGGIKTRVKIIVSENICGE